MNKVSLKYTIIKNRKQYNTYCKELERILSVQSKDKSIKDEAELLTLLIEKWDHEHDSNSKLDPVQLLLALMEENKIKQISLAEFLGVSKGLVSDILNYKKGMSKEIIRKLSVKFKVSQEGFNRVYPLMPDKQNAYYKQTGKVALQ